MFGVVMSDECVFFYQNAAIFHHFYGSVFTYQVVHTDEQQASDKCNKLYLNVQV